MVSRSIPEITLRRLPQNRHPQHSVWVEWTFSAVIPEIAPIAAFLADRLAWSKHDPRRQELRTHLERQAQSDPAGYRLEIPRKSAIIMWGLNMRWGHLAFAGSASVLAIVATWLPAYGQATGLPEMVVTATARPEPITQIAGTVQVIDRKQIENSTAHSVTDLLAENAVGFMSEWSAGQTSLNIRGASTEGQGRDFKSQVLVLINGHRAGTANISKLSPADIERIEIVRGPSSIVYGSQNMGGVVNIIMKTGRTAPGGLVEGSGGSWEGRQGKAQYGGASQVFDWYFGTSGGGRDNYDVGGGRKELNTSYKRFGATGSIGAQINDNHRLDFNIRTDGIYDEGFRGSSANLFAFDTRTNQSMDLGYHGRTEDDRFNWFLQGYAVHDVDDLNNPSPLSALNSVASRTTVDHNTRKLDIAGMRFQPRTKLWQEMKS